jgi:uncharacterized protein YdhG (YjbR/CyaY superfamily)
MAYRPVASPGAVLKKFDPDRGGEYELFVRLEGDGMKSKSATAEIATIDQYIQEFPETVRSLLTQMRATIKDAAPQATEKICYRMPTFYYNGNLVHFAAFTHHIGFYPDSSGIAAFKDQLKKYKGAKGSVQFPIDEPLPLKLIAKITKFRVAENAHKSVKGRKKAKLHSNNERIA